MSATAPSAPAPAPARDRGRGLLGGIVLYGATHGAAEGLLALRGLLLATLLGPGAFGVWALFRIATRYGAFAGLGLPRGMEREVAQGQDDLSARTALGFGLVGWGALGAGALALSFFVADSRLALGLRAFVAALVLEQVLLYALGYVRARGDLRRFALVELAGAALHTGLAAGLALVWGLAGAFAGFALACLGGIALCRGRAPLGPAFSGERLRRLMQIGLPQAATALLATALGTVDRLVVAAAGGTILLGYYAFAVSVAGLAGSLAWVVRTVVFPDLYSRARTGHALALREHLERTVLPLAWLLPPLLGVLALAVGPVVALALPKYAEAVPAARLFVFTGATAGLGSLAGLAVIAADRQRVLPVLTALATLGSLGLSYLALRTGAGLEGVAAAALASQAGWAAAMLAVAAREAALPGPRRFAAAVLMPLAWSALLVLVLGRVVPWMAQGEFAAFGLAVGAYLVLHLPLVSRLRSELGKVTAV